MLFFSGVGVSCLSATVGAITSVDSNSYYKFTLAPTAVTTIGNEKQITITNAKDINNFVYQSFTSANLTFSTPTPVLGGIWDPLVSSRLVLSGNNITDFISSNTTNKFTDYKTMYYNGTTLTNTDYVRYVVSSPSYLSYEHLTPTLQAGLYYKKNALASYTVYTFTMVFQEPSTLVSQTYAELPSVGYVGGSTTYITYHPPSGITLNSNISRVAGQKRVLTVSIKSNVTSGNGTGSMYFKIDNTTAVSTTTSLYENNLNGFFLGVNSDASGSFKGRIYYAQILPTQLTDTEVSTLHTNLKSTYGF